MQQCWKRCLHKIIAPSPKWCPNADLHGTTSAHNCRIAICLSHPYNTAMTVVQIV